MRHMPKVIYQEEIMVCCKGSKIICENHCYKCSFCHSVFRPKKKYNDINEIDHIRKTSIIDNEYPNFIFRPSKVDFEIKHSKGCKISQVIEPKEVNLEVQSYDSLPSPPPKEDVKILKKKDGDLFNEEALNEIVKHSVNQNVSN